MTSWGGFAADAPELATRVRARFDSGTNKTIATIRRDGSPRISGTELVITDADVTIDMMVGVKLGDIRRDPRVAIHSPTLEPPAEPAAWAGEAKLSGVLIEVAAPEKILVPDAVYFRLDITEAVHTSISADGKELVIESWHPDRGYRRWAR